MNTNKRKNLLATFVALFASGATVQANAQNEFGESATAQNVLDEIIVTSEKREQNVQDVPVAISAFSAEMLEARGISTPQDLQFSVPGLSIGEAYRGGNAKVFIRGVGNENSLLGGDPGVPIHINGHYTQSTAYILRDMLDVERVEVQRGPQGTLYGRNAIGGNINIITKRPTEEFESSVTAEVGNYSKRQMQAMVSGPLSDSLRGRLVVSDDNRDGYVKNLGSGGDDRDSSDYTSIRGSLEFDVSDSMQIYVNAYSFDDKGSNAVRIMRDYPLTDTAALLRGGPNYFVLNGAGSNPVLSDPFTIKNNTISEQTDESSGLSMDFTWDIGNIQFRSLSAFDDTTRTSINDLDGSDVVSWQEIWDSNQQLFTQEFQLLSNNSGPMQWVGGVFYLEEDSDLYYSFSSESIVAVGDPRRAIEASVLVGAKSAGIYGQFDYEITEKVSAVIGVRYTEDEKKNEQTIFIGIDGAPLFEIPLGQSQTKWNKTTGKLGLNYKINDDSMAYVSWSRGYKSGGYNFTQVPSYDPEVVDSYEAGLKSQWFDDSMKINVSSFYYDYQDKQDLQRAQSPQGLFFSHIRNASEATVKGIEFEIQVFPLEHLLVDVTVGYQKAKFDRFTTIDAVFPDLGDQDLAGNTLPFAPEWKVHFGAEYAWVLGSNFGQVRARLDYSWVDDQWSNGLNRIGDEVVLAASGDDQLPSYSIINGRLEWTSMDAVWQVSIYGKNITDEVVQTNLEITEIERSIATYLAPRSYGLEVEYTF